MKVLVTGSRYWDNYEAILRELGKLPSDTIIVHGACRGADIISGEIARSLGLEVREYHANWHRFGRAAGAIRNRQMLHQEHPELVIAFHEDISRSRGTKDMLSVAEAAGVQTHLVVG